MVGARLPELLVKGELWHLPVPNSRYRQYERNTRMLRSSPIPGALWDRAVATLFSVWRLRVREMCIPRGPPARLLFS